MAVSAVCGCLAGSPDETLAGLEDGSKFVQRELFPPRYYLYAALPRMREFMNPLERINYASTDEAESMFRDCCGSETWASMMTMVRPFASVDELINFAAAVWNDLQTEDWLETFAAHPKIGETKAAPAQQKRAAEWSSGEQAGMDSADASLIEELAEANKTYHEEFGFIFIVCATGKSGREMLDLCRTRLGNDRETEITIAAAEQQKITEIRLRKLLAL
jgi:OHCU decarboxylase